MVAWEAGEFGWPPPRGVGDKSGGQLGVAFFGEWGENGGVVRIGFWGLFFSWRFLVCGLLGLGFWLF